MCLRKKFIDFDLGFMCNNLGVFDEDFFVVLFSVLRSESLFRVESSSDVSVARVDASTIVYYNGMMIK